jgi:hypothetical protein
VRATLFGGEIVLLFRGLGRLGERKHLANPARPPIDTAPLQG